MYDRIIKYIIMEIVVTKTIKVKINKIKMEVK